MTLGDLAAVAAAGLGLMSVGLTVAGLIAAITSTKGALSSAREDRLRAVIDSADLTKMTKYLEEELGSVRLSAYAGKRAVQERVDVVLNRLVEYVGTDQDAEEEGIHDQPEPRVQPQRLRFFPEERLLERANDQIRGGDVWNGLALLRRAIEETLRKLVRPGESSQFHRGAGVMLRQLLKAGAVPADVSHPLGYAIHVANRGIHGEDIPADQAEEALVNGLVGLRILHGRPPQGPS